MRYGLSKDEYISGNIIYVPFTILGNRVLVFGFSLSQTRDFTFLYQRDQPLASIARHINNLPVSLDYFKQRLQAQNNRRIIYSWILPYNPDTTIVGVPFDFDASLTDRLKKTLDREKLSTLSRMRGPSREEIIRYHLLKTPERGSEIYPELLLIKVQKGLLTVDDIPTVYAFRNSHQVQLPFALDFEVRFLSHVYHPHSSGAFSRVHLLLINPEALRILMTTFDDSRLSFSGGTRMATESILGAITRECREESKNLIELTDTELHSAKFYYCGESKHVVVVLYTTRDFSQLASEYDKLPLTGKKENYGFRSIRIRDFLSYSLGSFGPNILSFVKWCREPPAE